MFRKVSGVLLETYFCYQVELFLFVLYLAQSIVVFVAALMA